MPNVTILPPQIGSGRIYFGDVEGEQDLQPVQVRGPEQRQADADATEAYFRRVAALQAERQAESERGKLPFEDMPGVYRPVWRGNELAMEIDPNAMAAAQQAVEAATQFQGIRGYQQALESGKSPSQALTEFAPLIFNKKYPASVGNMYSQGGLIKAGNNLFKPDPNDSNKLIQVTPPPRAAEVVQMEVDGSKRSFLRQPNGSMSEIKPPQDLELKDLQASRRAAEKAAVDAQTKLEAATATREEVIPARPGGLFTAPRPAVTNQVPLVYGKADEAAANLQAAKKRAEEAQLAEKNYLANKRGPVSTAKTPTQEEVNAAYQKAGWDKAKAKDILRKKGFKVD